MLLHQVVNIFCNCILVFELYVNVAAISPNKNSKQTTLNYLSLIIIIIIITDSIIKCNVKLGRHSHLWSHLLLVLTVFSVHNNRLSFHLNFIFPFFFRELPGHLKTRATSRFNAIKAVNNCPDLINVKFLFNHLALLLYQYLLDCPFFLLTL